MPITLGSNIASIRAQRKLNQVSTDIGGVYERLSSGQRINKAADDAGVRVPLVQRGAGERLGLCGKS